MPKSNGLEDDMGLDLIWPQSPSPVAGRSPTTSVTPEARGTGESRLAVLTERVASLEKQVTVLAQSVEALTKQLHELESRPPTKSVNRSRSAEATSRTAGRTARVTSPRGAGSA